MSTPPKRFIWVKVRQILEEDIPVEIPMNTPSDAANKIAVERLKLRAPNNRLTPAARTRWEYETEGL